MEITALTLLVRKSKMKLPGVSFFFYNTRKNFELNLVLVHVFVLKSEALY